MDEVSYFSTACSHTSLVWLLQIVVIAIPKSPPLSQAVSPGKSCVNSGVIPAVKGMKHSDVWCSGHKSVQCWRSKCQQEGAIILQLYGVVGVSSDSLDMVKCHVVCELLPFVSMGSVGTVTPRVYGNPQMQTELFSNPRNLDTLVKTTHIQ